MLDEHLTPAVSRRAMYGTRKPQSYHWRGRLHCFVRPALYRPLIPWGDTDDFPITWGDFDKTNLCQCLNP